MAFLMPLLPLRAMRNFAKQLTGPVSIDLDRFVLSDFSVLFEVDTSRLAL